MLLCGQNLHGGVRVRGLLQLRWPQLSGCQGQGDDPGQIIGSEQSWRIEGLHLQEESVQEEVL